jgi:hypothetical protein
MAAVTQTRNQYQTGDGKTIVTATFTSPVDTNTWDTGLSVIDYVNVFPVEAADAADAVTAASISGGVVTLGVAGTITSARARAEGV